MACERPQAYHREMNTLRPLALAALFAFAAPQAQAADAYASDWAKGLKSSARLVAAGGGVPGALRAGVEIMLDPDTITYWRSPGDAGVPPVFKFGASQNVANVEVTYPAPQRVNENGAEAFGYLRGVIFPLRVTPRDPALPVRLELSLDYAACEKICIPAQAELALALPQAGAPNGPHAGRIALAESRAPRRQALGEAAPLSLRAVSAKGADWTLEIIAPEGVKDVSVFPEGPEYFFLKSGVPTRKAAGAFSVPLRIEDRPKDATGVDATITIVADGNAIEVPVRLEAGPAKP